MFRGMNSIFDYMDYREYLRDVFTTEKKDKAFFSYRYVSQRTGIDSGQLTKILQGQLHLSARNIKKINDFLQLQGKEEEYFNLLVHFGKARNSSEVEMYFQKIMSFREITPHEMNAEQLTFYSQWYYVALYAYLSIHPAFKPHVELARTLVPPVEAKHIENALETLKALGLIVENPKLQCWEITQKHLSTPEKWSDSMVKTFQRNTLNLAVDALQSIPKQHRHFTTLTISINPETLEQLKAITEEYRRSVIKLVEECNDPTMVMHLNTQIFPVSQWEIK